MLMLLVLLMTYTHHPYCTPTRVTVLTRPMNRSTAARPPPILSLLERQPWQDIEGIMMRRTWIMPLRYRAAQAWKPP